MSAQRYNNLLYDYLLLASLISILLIIGTLFIYSSSCVYALEKYRTPHFYAKKQLFGMFLGFFIGLCIQCVPVSAIKKSSGGIFYGFIIGLFTMFLYNKISIHGARRWLFVYGISIQPSEFLKVIALIYSSAILAKKKQPFYAYLIHISCVLITSCTVLLLQPDFGTACVLACTIFLLYFVANCPWRYILLSIASTLPIIYALIINYPYRVQRILTFLNPWQDPQGAGFQIIQSLIAIGSGGLTGLGISHSKQKFFYLPMQHTDFIFSIIAEETGFIGSFSVVLVYIGLLYIGIRLAIKCRSTFNTLCILAFIYLISVQAMINIAVATSLAPTKGIGLPFISYGNSSLIGYLIFFGIITRIVRHELALLKPHGYKQLAN